MGGSMTTTVVKNGDGMEIHWPIGMKVVSGLVTLLLGVGVLALIDMRVTLAVLAKVTEDHIESPLHSGSVPRSEVEAAHTACRESYNELRERVLALERR